MSFKIKSVLGAAGAVLTAGAAIASSCIMKYNFKIKSNRINFDVNPYKKNSKGGSRIHFLSTGSSDAVLLESAGKFALVDCAEDSDNPRGFKELDYKGYEDVVLEYLKANAVNESGNIHLDFIVGTHSHSDHIGGFDTIISESSVSIDKAYLKEYNEAGIVDSEVIQWDNKEVYNQMLEALKQKNIPVISNIDNTPFKLGDFTVTFFNTQDINYKKVGENDNSLGVLVEMNGSRIFLAGDINNLSGDETRLAPLIGKVDLLKVGHHSYAGSTSTKWLKALNPDVCVVTNNSETTDKRTLRRIIRISDSVILVTGQENGVVAEINDDGSISYFNNIH